MVQDGRQKIHHKGWKKEEMRRKRPQEYAQALAQKYSKKGEDRKPAPNRWIAMLDADYERRKRLGLLPKPEQSQAGTARQQPAPKEYVPPYLKGKPLDVILEYLKQERVWLPAQINEGEQDSTRCKVNAMVVGTVKTIMPKRGKAVFLKHQRRAKQFMGSDGKVHFTYVDGTDGYIGRANLMNVTFEAEISHDREIDLQPDDTVFAYGQWVPRYRVDKGLKEFVKSMERAVQFAKKDLYTKIRELGIVDVDYLAEQNPSLTSLQNLLQSLRDNSKNMKEVTGLHKVFVDRKTDSVTILPSKIDSVHYGERSTLLQSMKAEDNNSTPAPVVVNQNEGGVGTSTSEFSGMTSAEAVNCEVAQNAVTVKAAIEGC